MKEGGIDPRYILEGGGRTEYMMNVLQIHSKYTSSNYNSNEFKMAS
jgi:hypothetical protein